jgi:hypothetical protein
VAKAVLDGFRAEEQPFCDLVGWARDRIVPMSPAGSPLAQRQPCIGRHNPEVGTIARAVELEMYGNAAASCAGWSTLMWPWPDVNLGARPNRAVGESADE